MCKILYCFFLAILPLKAEDIALKSAFYFSIATHGGASAMDGLMSTRIPGYAHGYYETNPWTQNPDGTYNAQRGSAIKAAMFGGITAAEIWAVRKEKDRNSRRIILITSIALNTLGTVFYTRAAINNSHLR